MSDADTSGGGSNGPGETTNINIRVTESFLAEIDTVWQEEGYTSRSEFLRHAIRDATEHPGLSRDAWITIAAEEYEMRKGLAEPVGREEVLSRMNDE